MAAGKDRAMCQHLTVLAQWGEQRLIAQCEHDTLHLVWNHVTLALHPCNCAEPVNCP